MIVGSRDRIVPASLSRRLYEAATTPDKQMLVVDGAGVIYRRLSDRFEATVNFNNPHMARDLVRQFEEMWQTAVPDINLRRSHL